MEKEKIVRKLETVNSIDELGLLKTTINCLRKRRLTEPADIIRFGRKRFIELKIYPANENQKAKWEQDLIEKLETLGLIRRELFPMTYCIWKLYHAIFGETIIKNFLDDDFYESIRPVTDVEVCVILDELEGLSSRDIKMIIDHFGLVDQKIKTLEAVGKRFLITREYIHYREAKVFKELRRPAHRDGLPNLFGLEIKEELDPDIDSLDLSIRPYYCLRKAKINTVYDILNFSKREWKRIRGLGPKSYAEIESEMHRLGYKDFKILS